MSLRPARPARPVRPRSEHRRRGWWAILARSVVVSCAALTVLVAVFASYAPDQLRAAATLASRGEGPSSAADPTGAPGGEDPAGSPRRTERATVPTPVRLERAAPVAKIGVASFNVNKYREKSDIAADVDRLTARDDVDVIGWQEVDEVGDLFPALADRGWSTRFFTKGGREAAISWRRALFSMTSSRSIRAHPGNNTDTSAPFPGRYITEVALEHRDSGERLTVLDTHVNHYIENFEARAGLWRRNLNAVDAKRHLERMAEVWQQATGRWVVGTGDMNFDYRADRDTRPTRGISQAFDGLARSSYDALGLKGLPPTHTATGRWIDYVFAGSPSLDSGRITFLSHRALAGFGSDHRPLLARVALR